MSCLSVKDVVEKLLEYNGLKAWELDNRDLVESVADKVTNIALKQGAVVY